MKASSESAPGSRQYPGRVSTKNQNTIKLATNM